MKRCIDSEKVLARLGKIEGQVRGIKNMISCDTKEFPCDEILIQIGAVNSALYKVGQIILEGHLRSCVVDGIKAGDEEKTMQKLSVALDRFSRIR